MQTNPYAPPQAVVADPEPTSHGLKRRGLLLMVVLTIVTLGFYYLVWWFRRRPGLNRLNSPRKLAIWPLLVFTAQFVLQFGLGFLEGAAPELEVIGEGGKAFVTLFQVAVGILMIVQAFKIKNIIEDHAEVAQSESMFVEPVQLSGLMTFFFSIYYLQWAINRYVAEPQS
jgi:hypothetical protein